MQNQLKKGRLLDDNGHLIEAGYATQLVKAYERNAIKAKSWRIKEWDYYYIGNEQYGIALTIADNRYMGLVSVTFLDFIKPSYISKSFMSWFTMGKYRLPETSTIGSVAIHNKKFDIVFENDGKVRKISCSIRDFKNKETLECMLELREFNQDTMCIAIPFAKPTYFYYNQKINNLIAKGRVRIGTEVYHFNDALGVLDWGRGVWTYKNTWYWSSLSAKIDGKMLGFNLGYGFGDTSKASENMIFYDGVCEKLDQVTFHIPTDAKGNKEFEKPWQITSNDDKLLLTFSPIIDRYSNTSVVVIASCQHQVFGRFSGYVRVQGKVVTLHNLLGFAEEVKNKW